MIKERHLFSLLTALVCLPVWLVSHFPSQDGPSHVYNAQVFLSLLTSSHTTLGDWYILTPGLTTNVSAHLLLGLLSTVCPPAIAEKILVTLCIVLLAAGLRYAAGAVNPRGTVLAPLAFPAITGVSLHMGFYGFLLGAALFCFACGYWFRRWGLFTAKETIYFAALLVALFLSHLMPWAVTILVIGVPALWVAVRHSLGMQYLLPTMIAGVPSFALLLVYVGYVHPPLLAGPLFPVRSLAGLLMENPVVSLSWMEEYLFWGLAFVATVLTAFVVRRKLMRRRWSSYDWLAPLSAFLLLLFLAAPIGAMGGAYLRGRFWLFSGFTLLLWFSSGRFTRRDRVVISVVATFLTAATAWIHWRSYRLLDPHLRDVAAVHRIIPDGRSVLNLRYSQSWPREEGQPLCLRIDCFLYAGAAVVHGPGDVWINNYEASIGLFPLSWREGLETRRIGSFDAEPPCVDLLSWQAQTARSIDYVMLTGYPAEEGLSGCAGVTLRQLNQSYDLIYRSGSRFVLVYRRRPN